MHPVLAYIRFLLRSSNQHGVHSPFVYDLITKCFYDKTTHNDYSILKEYRTSLLKNPQTIEVTDFGAGSRVFNSNTRKVSTIAKNAGISPKRARLLNRMIRCFQPKNILELGTSLGIATSAMSLGNPISEIITLEGCPQTMNIAKQQFKTFQLKNIKSIIGKFEDTLPELSDQKLDLVYFDGNHQKDATLRYFETLLPTTHNNSIWIFDDIHWSSDMELAWNSIKEHPEVTVTIDTFHWGLVFFRKEQQCQNFIIRV